MKKQFTLDIFADCRYNNAYKREKSEYKNEMFAEKIGEKLNNLVKREFSSRKIKRKLGDIEFFDGRCSDILFDLLGKNAPNGKILCIYSPESFDLTASVFSAAINKVGAEQVNLITDNFSNEIENMSIFFNAGDDVRAVIYCDACAATCATYFAANRKLPIFYIPSAINQSGALPSKLFIKSGNKIDEIETRVKTFVIIDDSLIQKVDVSEAYASIIGNFPAIFDFRVRYSLFPDKSLLPAFTSYKDAIIDVYKIKKEREEDIAVFLLGRSLTLELSERASGGCIFGKSSVGVLTRMYNNPFNKIKALSFLIGMYSVVVSYSPPFGFVAPDYDGHAQAVSKFFGIDYSYVVDSMITQAAVIRKNKTNIKESLNGMKKAVLAVEKSLHAVEKTYVKLGGEKFSEISNELIIALLRSGDISLNVMSVAREWGYSSTETQV